MEKTTLLSLIDMVKSFSGGGKRYCFILGAGASKASGIKTGSEMAKEWLEELKINEPEDTQKWIKDNEINEGGLGSDYSKIYERRFRLEPASGFMRLQKEMENAIPSPGYYHLAQIIDKTQNKLVITTNFDSMTEDALFIYRDKKALVINHESLAKYIDALADRPMVIKLHRDLLLQPRSSEDDVGTLPKEWEESLKKIMDIYVPIVIGYGGNDGSLMGFLESVSSKDRKIYWCYREDGEVNDKIKELLEKYNGFLVSIDDFDDTMQVFGDKFGYDFSEETIKDANNKRAEKLIKQYKELTAKRKEDLKKKETKKSLSSTENMTFDSFKSSSKRRIEILEANIAKNSKNSENYYALGDEFLFQREYNRAIEQYTKAIDIKPDFYEAFNNWGVALGKLAMSKMGKEAENLFQQSFTKYQKAVDIKHDYYEALYNWGLALETLAESKTDKEAEDLLLQAIEKYKKVTDIKPGDNEAFYNWGLVLSRLAESKTGKEVEDLLLQAIEKYKKVTDIKPDDNEAFNNWGFALSKLAESKKGKEAEDSLLRAIKKYKEAIDIKPDDNEAFNNWGFALSRLAESKTGKEAEDLLLQAFEKCQKAVDLGGDSYNLACCHALKGNKEKALQYLEKSLENNEISSDFVLKDSDWKDFLSDSTFMDLINKYK